MRPILESWKHEALEIAKKRRNLHKSYGSTRHWDDATKTLHGEYTDEYYGVLGEVIFRERVEQVGLSSIAQYPPAFARDQRNLPAWDAKLGNCEIEIKTVPPDNGKRRTRMLVKVSEMKAVDVYVAIKLLDENTYRFCGFATHAELVSSSPVQFTYSLSYAIPLDRMPHQLVGRWWEVHCARH